MFPADSLAKIHEFTDGIPRLINQVSDFALIIAGTRGQQSVSASIIEEAWADVQSIPGMISPSPTTTEQDSDWTVIEFGSLDDEGSDGEGTVYEFGSSPEIKQTPEPAPAPSNAIEFGALPDEPVSSSSSLSHESGQSSEFSSIQNIIDDANDYLPPAEATPAVIELGPPQQTHGETSQTKDDVSHELDSSNADQESTASDVPIEVPIEEPANVDPEFGIDFAALQRKQQERQQQAELKAHDELGPQAGTEPEAELLDNATVAEEENSTRASLSGVPDAEALERQKEEMAAQFAAVFGKTPDTAEPVDETPAEPHIEQPVSETGFVAPTFTLEEQRVNEGLMDEQEALLNSVDSTSSSPTTHRTEQQGFDDSETSADNPFPQPSAFENETPAFENETPAFPNEAPVYETGKYDTPSDPMADEVAAGSSEAPSHAEPELPPLDVASFVRPKTTTAIVNHIADAFDSVKAAEEANPVSTTNNQADTSKLPYPEPSASTLDVPVTQETTDADAIDLQSAEASSHPTNVDLVATAPSAPTTPGLSGFNIEQFTASIEAARAFDQTRPEPDAAEADVQSAANGITEEQPTTFENPSEPSASDQTDTQRTENRASLP